MMKVIKISDKLFMTCSLVLRATHLLQGHFLRFYRGVMKKAKIKKANNIKLLACKKMVGLTGFEPATSSTPRKRASQAALQPDTKLHSITN